jgi:hypothetical protein
MRWALLLLGLAGCGGLQVVQLTTRSEPQWQVTRAPAQSQPNPEAAPAAAPAEPQPQQP